MRVCVCVFISAPLTCGASVSKHNLTATATEGKGEKKGKKEPWRRRRRREAQEFLRHFLTPSLLLPHSLHLAFLFNTHFPSLLVLSLKFQSLCLLKIQANDVLWRCFLSLLTSSFLIREKPKQETHQHRFLCDLPRRRRPSLAPRTADCWAVTHTNLFTYKLIPDILTDVSVPAYTSDAWNVDMRTQEMETTWYCTVIWAAISRMACGLICSQPSHSSKNYHDFWLMSCKYWEVTIRSQFLDYKHSVRLNRWPWTELILFWQ